MASSRREFVAGLASAAALAAIGLGSRPAVLGAIDAHPRAGDPVLRELVARALDAAKAAGATYADVRFTLTRTEEIGTIGLGPWWTPVNDEHAAVGIRALADGAWGFAASNVWTGEEVARLAREATVQALTNARRSKSRIELTQPPTVASGEWVMPVGRDPFTVSLAEKLDVIWSLAEGVSRVNAPVAVGTSSYLRHRRQEKTFGSTDGSFTTQTLYLSHPYFTASAQEGRRFSARTFDRLQPAAAGWEIMTEPTMHRDLPQLVEDAVAMLRADPVEPDRYDIVCDAFTTARVLGLSVGVAAELDRVLGGEANGAGTSYLAPVDEVLDKFVLGPATLNVEANRSHGGALATVKWDDEGIVPSVYAVVRDGVLVNYHTTRGAVTSPGSRQPVALRSFGCASADNARNITMLHTPNIAMRPAADGTTLEDLASGLERGLVIVGGAAHPRYGTPVTMDRQQLNGEINANYAYEVRNGRRTRFIRNTEVLFRAPEFWKGLQAMGGESSLRWTGMSVSKGQPTQDHYFGVAAVPARFARVPVTDRTRRA